MGSLNSRCTAGEIVFSILADLVAAKQAARHHRGQDRLAQASPASGELLQQAAARGTPLARVTAQLVQLLDDYGAGELECAIIEALASGVPHPNAVRQVLERRRETANRPPPLTLTLPDNDKARQIVVRPASLAGYDQIQEPCITTDTTDEEHANDNPNESD